VVGSIASQSTAELAVEPGSRTLRLSSHRHLSPERSFEAGEGQVVSFWCRAAMFWPRYVAALVKPDLRISLKQPRAQAEHIAVRRSNERSPRHLPVASQSQVLYRLHS
jgi:hypothetical protein